MNSEDNNICIYFIIDLVSFESALVQRLSLDPSGQSVTGDLKGSGQLWPFSWLSFDDLSVGNRAIFGVPLVLYRRPPWFPPGL